MTWAQRLKRVFGIDIQTGAVCSGAVRIVACIEEPEVIERILAHLDKNLRINRMAPALPAVAAAGCVRFIRFTGMIPQQRFAGCADGDGAATLPAGRVAGVGVKCAPPDLRVHRHGVHLCSPQAWSPAR
jgi:hypothetical protein